MPAKPGQAQARPPIDDFELVRNGEGQWLLVLPELPETLAADPTAPLGAVLEGGDLILEQTSGRALLRSLVAPQYIQPLRTDKPDHLLLCVVDDEGVRQLIRKIPLRL